MVAITLMFTLMLVVVVTLIFSGCNFSMLVVVINGLTVAITLVINDCNFLDVSDCNDFDFCIYLMAVVSMT